MSTTRNTHRPQRAKTAKLRRGRNVFTGLLITALLVLGPLAIVAYACGGGHGGHGGRGGGGGSHGWGGWHQSPHGSGSQGGSGGSSSGGTTGTPGSGSGSGQGAGGNAGSGGGGPAAGSPGGGPGSANGNGAGDPGVPGGNPGAEGGADNGGGPGNGAGHGNGNGSGNGNGNANGVGNGNGNGNANGNGVGNGHGNGGKSGQTPAGGVVTEGAKGGKGDKSKSSHGTIDHGSGDSSSSGPGAGSGAGAGSGDGPGVGAGAAAVAGASAAARPLTAAITPLIHSGSSSSSDAGGGSNASERRAKANAEKLRERTTVARAVDGIPLVFRAALLILIFATSILAVVSFRERRRATAVARIAQLDHLTGLANREGFDRQMAIEWSRALRHGRPLGLVFVDLDHFKAFNDTHGHVAGDRLLREVAAAITATARASDFTARLGGDEFVVLCPDTDAAGLERLVERLRIEAAGMAVTLSIGAASRRDGDTSSDELVHRADVAMYAAKGGRRRGAKSTNPMLGSLRRS